YTKSGTYQIKVMNTGIECPFAVLETSIIVPAIGDKNITITQKADDCKTDEICFNVSGNYVGTLMWSFGDPTTGVNNTSTLSSPCHKFSKTGTFDVTIKNINQVCPFADVVTKVTIVPAFKVNPIADTIICEGKTVKLKVSSNDPKASYTWTDAMGVVLGTDTTLTLSPMTDVIVTLKGISEKGCIDSTKVSVRMFKFDYTIQVPPVICPKTNFQATITIANPGNYTFLWTPSESIVSGATTSQPTLTPIPGKTITVMIIHKATGCSDTRSITPVVNPALVFNFSGALCNNQPSTVTLNIANPNNYTYQWSPASVIVSGGQTPNPSVRLSASQELTVVVTNKVTGCAEELKYTPIVAPPVPIVFTDPTLEINLGKSAVISIRNPLTGAQYTWNTGDRGTSITVMPLETTTYTVSVTDQSGCAGTAQITVTVRVVGCTDTDEFVANVFTPNGDNINDVLHIKSNVLEEATFVIFNRWGQEVFNTTDINRGWDGTFKGNLMKPDAYAYYIIGTCINGDKVKKKGNVTLIR
ncbi:MAG: gliding motility-associated C-terminal domain-containing protein, partial [Saprospiraceae bacterium]